MSACARLLLVAAILCSAPPGTAAGGAPQPVEPDAVNLDVNQADFPDSSLIDFSYLLDPPAGKHGFLHVTEEGHFAFADATPVRFWGINIAKDSVFQPRPIIDAAVDAIARAGFNLVRLHHLDDTTGLLPAQAPSGGGRIAPEALAAVDYWVARLKARGIYVYVDLLSYRTFWDWEGVAKGQQLDRGAKPYAVFDDGIIALQQAYADELLVRHVNPHTGLSYANDPSVCLIELCDENGLLRRPEAAAALVEPYASRLRARWNRWLRERYRGTDALRRACGEELGTEESLENGTVRLGAEGPRAADFARFAFEVHGDYFRRMRSFLRGKGVRVPVTAVGAPGQLPDVRAVAEELDFVGTNFYWDHPFYPADRQWVLPALYRNENETASSGVEAFIPATAICKVGGTPLVVREWGACWPNKYRSAPVPSAAAYADLQGYDGMILFTYDTRESARRLSFFDVRRDPARWGMMGPAARCFLAGDVATASQGVTITWSDADTFAPRLPPRRRPDVWRSDDLFDIGWTRRVSNVFGPAPVADADGPAAEGALRRPRAEGRFVSVDGELVRDERSGVFTADAPHFQAIAGRLDAQPELATSQLSLRSQTAIGTLCAATFDGKPLAESGHYVLKMVSFAVNTGEEKHLRGSDHGREVYALTEPGEAPVLTMGRATEQPTSVSIGGRRLLDVYLRNGTWELVREPGRFLLYCDTPGTRFVIQGLPGDVAIARHGADGNVDTQELRQPLPYPALTRCVEIALDGAG